MARHKREGRGIHMQPSSRLRPDVHEMIGRRLRLHYEELQQQPLPDRLADLLERLDRQADHPPPQRR
jgi:hypothetical protein